VHTKCFKVTRTRQYTKNCADLLAVPGQFLPDIWKSATVTPLFKKGSKLDPGNYRPVSLTCISCEIMESIIRDHIAGQLNNSAGLSASQHGFTKGRSSATNLLTAFELWTKWIDEGFGVDIVYWTTVKRSTRMIMSN